MKTQSNLKQKKAKEVLLEIGFIEEIRTTCGNKEMPQTFFHNCSYSRKYVLIRLTPTIGKYVFRIFVTSQKVYCRSVVYVA